MPDRHEFTSPGAQVWQNPVSGYMDFCDTLC